MFRRIQHVIAWSCGHTARGQTLGNNAVFYDKTVDIVIGKDRQGGFDAGSHKPSVAESMIRVWTQKGPFFILKP